MGYCLDDLKRGVAQLLGSNEIEFSPKVCMADGSAAIARAVREHFPSTLRLNCFFHAMKSIRTKLKQFNLVEEDRTAIKCDVRVLSCARDEAQFVHWVSLFNTRWGHICPDFVSYMNSGFHNLDKWCSRYYWGAGGPICLVNSRTNNSVENFNKVFHNQWMHNRQLPLRRLMGVLLGVSPEVNSRGGSALPQHMCLGKKILVPMWKCAALSETLMDGAISLGETHWFHDDWGPFDGELFASGVQCMSDAERLLEGLYDPFDDSTVPWVLTYFPKKIEHLELNPPKGPCCTCITFMKHNICIHMLVMAHTRFGYPYPSAIVRIDTSIRSHGAYRPKTRPQGGRACLRPFRGQTLPTPVSPQREPRMTTRTTPRTGRMTTRTAPTVGEEWSFYWNTDEGSILYIGQVVALQSRSCDVLYRLILGDGKLGELSETVTRTPLSSLGARGVVERGEWRVT